MQDAPHNKALRAALDQTAAYGIQPTRSCHLRSPEDGARFVQRQIAGTLLARRLVFHIDGSKRLECDAAGGRLLRFCTYDPQGKVVFSGDFEDLSAAQGADAPLRVFSDSLPRSFLDAKTVSLHTLPMHDAPRTGGISAHHLAKALGLATPPVTPPQWFRTFIEDAKGAILAAAYLEDDLLYPLAGTDQDIDQLAENVAHLVPDIETLTSRATIPEDALIVLGTNNNATPNILFAAHNTSTLIALISPNTHTALTRKWYALRRAD
ncbi:MAG: hypothetical protein QNJ09_16100 [Paracoccaceae bacterium]|nr:hypothetical protein [Paracoccaceae bacterium]